MRVYPSTYIPPGFEDEQSLFGPDAEDKLKLDEIVYRSLQDTAGPGVPLCIFGSTNKEIKEKVWPFVKKCVVERLRLLSTYEMTQRDTPESLVRRGFCDPVRVFIKNELTGLSKIARHAPRLIMSVSLVDQIVERCLDRKSVV